MRVLRTVIAVVAMVIIAFSAFVYFQTAERKGGFSFLSSKTDTAQAHAKTDAALGRFTVVSLSTVAVAGGLIYILREPSKGGAP